MGGVQLRAPTFGIAEKVVARMRSWGLDGIAITDHHDKDWSFKFRDLVEKLFPGEVTIIPG